MDSALKRLTVFIPLAFVLSWYSFVLFHLGVPRATGGINPLGPALAALITAWAFDGGPGVKELLGRYLRWRVGWFSYGFALLIPLVLSVSAAAINLLLGAHAPGRAQLAAWPQIIPAFVFILLFIGLGEETGWRGYALPQLQRRYSPLVASLVLGVIWAVWHIPLMGGEFQPPVIPFFVASVLAGSVVSAWLFNRAKGSLLPLPIFHATVNSVGAGYIFPMFNGRDLTRLWWVYVALWTIVALGLALSSSVMRRRPISALSAAASA
jgi:uncharacterized protein